MVVDGLAETRRRGKQGTSSKRSSGAASAVVPRQRQGLSSAETTIGVSDTAEMSLVTLPALQAFWTDESAGVSTNASSGSRDTVIRFVEETGVSRHERRKSRKSVNTSDQTARRMKLQFKRMGLWSVVCDSVFV